MHQMRKTSILKASTATIAFGLTLAANPAFAQDQADPAPDDAVATAPAEETPVAITVTGSRIARPNLESTAPIGVISSEALDTRGFTSVAQALNELP